jgi:hypothetical protein
MGTFANRQAGDHRQFAAMNEDHFISTHRRQAQQETSQFDW